MSFPAVFHQANDSPQRLLALGDWWIGVPRTKETRHRRAAEPAGDEDARVPEHL